MSASLRLVSIALMLCAMAAPLYAQEPSASQPDPARVDTRTQYPPLLANSFVGVTIGRIDYPFSSVQLQPGFRAASIDTPRPTVRVTLFGHQFNRFISAQATYMRPVSYVSYRDINGTPGGHHVWMHFAGVTLMPTLPVTNRLSLFGEAGMGITSRSGFEDGTTPVVRDANFWSPLLGAGADYQTTDRLALTGGVTYVRGRTADAQPRTVVASAGLRYTMRPLPPERVAAALDGNYFFPRQMVQFEYTIGVGYGVNTFLSRNIPVFWGGNARVDHGFALHYDRNVFHTRKIFSFDVGGSASTWASNQKDQHFVTLSIYPLLRLTLLRTAPADLYFQYSLAGPTFISEPTLDDHETGRHFTFQDFMGVGAFIGKGRRLTAGIKINHYSNGNIFTENAGVKVPLTVTLGYVF